MNYQDFLRSKILNNIPNKKLQDKLFLIENSKDDLKTKNIKITAINRFAESNIPIEQWNLNIAKDFTGDSRLLTKYNEYILNIKSSYDTGKSICFAGNHGVGKTTICAAIIKKAVLKGYSGLYTTLSDMVNSIINSNGDEALILKKELMMVDFLVVDEVDPRFMSTNNASDLYARTLENIFRTRSQNKLPTLMCTNSPNVIESFTGSLKASLDSLMNGYMEIFIVLGDDFRKKI